VTKDTSHHELNEDSRISAAERSRARQIVNRFGVACALLFLFLATSLSAEIQKLGDLSFFVPDGYSYEFTPGEDHATIGFAKGQEFCVLVIYNPTRTSGDPEADFKATWPVLLGKSAGPGLPSPIFDIQTAVGFHGKQSGSFSTNGRNLC
jgi:hypothetical protein